MADRKVRYAVVGLGHISQVAALPAFEHAENSEVVALVSGDPEKLAVVGERFGVRLRVGYDGYDALLESGEVDAVYIGLPNHLHRDFTVRAARASVHVLCEKPMAVTEAECEEMIRACADNDVKLMVAYRLHFDPANLAAMRRALDGDLGELRYFDSTFSQDVVEGDIRLNPIEAGGGTLYDMGIYCINAARYLFRYEPIEVMAFTASRNDPRFENCDEMTSATLRFPGDRLATFTSSFGAKHVSRYQLVGTRGELRLENAYQYAADMELEVRADGDIERQTFEKHDQFAPELIYFSDCILDDAAPEPDGYEGLADIRIIQALYKSANTGRAVEVDPVRPQQRPQPGQEINRPPVEKPPEVKASGPKRK